MRRLVILTLTALVLLEATMHPTLAADNPPDLMKKARAVLAQLEGKAAIPGLKEPVEILRDRWGVPHIYARNQDDLFFAQGFVVAQDRLWQIDWWRRVGVGETAEVLGQKGLPGDRIARLVRYRGDMEKEWTSYSPDTQRIATAFTRGINAYIDHIGDRLPIEFQVLGYRPQKWQPEDVLGRMSGIIMTRNFRSELERASLVHAVGVEKARRLAPTDPPQDFAPLPGIDLAGLDKSLLDDYEAATKPVQFATPNDGSNNWAIDGSRSASGKPMLASDPHRALTLPSLRYLVHLNAPGWNVIGAGEPGLPGVALGHNDRIAWGITIVGTDQADWYVEETDPSDPTRYRTEKGWEPMTVIKEKVMVKGTGPTEVELRFTRHGPVLHQDEKRNRALALRWIGSEPGTAAYLGAAAVSRARNWKEFREALKGCKVPSLNYMYADVDGHIGWVAAGAVPIRKGWDGLLPVPGAAGKYEWQGFLDITDQPQALDPPDHFLATANHNILPPDYRREIAYEWAPSYRIDVLRARLGTSKKFDLTDMQKLQHNVTCLPGKRMAALVRKIPSQSDLQRYVDLLAEWDGELTAESSAGALYAAWMEELTRDFYGRYAADSLLDFLKANRGIDVMLDALDREDPAFFKDRADRDALLSRTFARAVERIRSKLGDDPGKWTWGQLHQTHFPHALSRINPAFDLQSVPYGGDGYTPNNGRYNDKLEKIHGASYRHVLDLADWDRGLATSVPGQSGQPGSPHYADLLPLWQKGEYFPLAFSRAKVEEMARHRLQLTPAQ